MLKPLEDLQREGQLPERRFLSLIVLYNEPSPELKLLLAELSQKSCVETPKGNFVDQFSAFCSAVPTKDCCITSACPQVNKERKLSFSESAWSIKYSIPRSYLPNLPTNMQLYRRAYRSIHLRSLKAGCHRYCAVHPKRGEPKRSLVFTHIHQI